MRKHSSQPPRRLGPFLQDARGRAGLTQSEAARSLGYQSQFISEWERGVRSPPANVFKRLIELYGIAPQEFYDILRSERLAKLDEELQEHGFRVAGLKKDQLP